MNWHARYIQQSNWTRNLREYLFKKIGLKDAQRVLEVGCGTGAILGQISTHAPHGLDILPASLIEAQIHAPDASLTCGDVLSLPFLDNTFNVTFCHYLLLWVADPQSALAEMKRVTKKGGHILALAEPDYASRVDKPAELAVLGRWQTESLLRQGADPALGAKLAEMFSKAEIELLETGAIESQGNEAPTSAEWEMEWAVLESDLAGSIPAEKFQYLKKIDEQAWASGRRVLHVPTYFAWGRV